jgi:HAD superfamily hydrolase (TIGR01459 family)
LIEEGVARGLPFVCANPDLVVDVGKHRRLCAGSIALEYERQGGRVFWAGKPHPAAYNTALERTCTMRGRPVHLSRILAIGDAVRTDMAAAKGIGIDALFIASGIHNDAVLINGEIDPEKLAMLFSARDSPPAIAAMTHLRP